MLCKDDQWEITFLETKQQPSSYQASLSEEAVRKAVNASIDRRIIWRTASAEPNDGGYSTTSSRLCESRVG
ncbi:Nuclear protein localization protein [Trichinella spiralis]|uniref:Nuclear protein localization protein n=1 Tax=Trichinella spiralis TaxID=6334 RepID=A0ABR3KID7_TRISP